jgi:multidrug efflux pump subunit AcrA (membrane-fusion protein)
MITPPASAEIPIGDGVAAEMTIGLEAHPDQRTVSLLATPSEPRDWIRPGVSAFLEVTVDSTDGYALAIPRSAIVKDGIVHVFFLRDRNDPNKAIRVEADMGVSDGRWVAINSGIALNDEVVLNGAYELKLASQRSGVSQKGGHFHADGTFHEEDH